MAHRLVHLWTKVKIDCQRNRNCSTLQNVRECLIRITKQINNSQCPPGTDKMKHLILLLFQIYQFFYIYFALVWLKMMLKLPSILFITNNQHNVCLGNSWLQIHYYTRYEASAVVGLNCMNCKRFQRYRSRCVKI